MRRGPSCCASRAPAAPSRGGHSTQSRPARAERTRDNPTWKKLYEALYTARCGIGGPIRGRDCGELVLALARRAQTRLRVTASDRLDKAIKIRHQRRVDHCHRRSARPRTTHAPVASRSLRRSLPLFAQICDAGTNTRLADARGFDPLSRSRRARVRAHARLRTRAPDKLFPCSGSIVLTGPLGSAAERHKVSIPFPCTLQ